MNLNKPAKFMICALLVTIAFSSIIFAGSYNPEIRDNHRNSPPNIEDIIGNPDYDDMQFSAEYIESMFNYDSRENVDPSDILNPFAQPNENLSDSYGSGDSEEDGDVDLEDYREMMISAPQNDYSDVNGDGVMSSIEDINLLRSFLNPLTRAHRNLNPIKNPINHLRRAIHQPLDSSEPSQIPPHIPYSQGHWNSLQTADERIDWMEKMLAIDLTDEIPLQSGGVETRWMSGNYMVQLLVNMFGYDENDIHSKYNLDYLGRFNLPVYQFVYFDPITGIGHGANAVLVGEDPTNIYDWAYIEPQTDVIERIDESVFNFLADTDFCIGGALDFSSPSAPDWPIMLSLLCAHVDEDGNYDLAYLNPEMITVRGELETL
jgi:hypothetical protein